MTFFSDHSLLLVGAVVLAIFGVFRLVISSGVLRPIARRESAPVLHKILNYGFLLVLTVVILSFGLVATASVLQKVLTYGFILSFAFVVLDFGLAAWRIQKDSGRRRQAKTMLAAEVTQNIRSLDERLGYFRTILDQPIQNEQLEKIREKHLPSMSQIFANSYTRLMNEQRITTLRQMLNSSPLQKESGVSVIDNVLHGDVNAEQYQSFYKSIAETERATENLLSSLSLLSSPGAGSNKEWATYNHDQVKVATENLGIESHLAYIAALRALYLLSSPPYPVEIPEGTLETLRNLSNLDPKKLPTPAEMNSLSSDLIARKEAILARKSDLLERAKKLSADKLNQYANIDELFSVGPTDTWNQVIGKAISLREIGRTSEAIAAFSQYADLFSSGDPGAENYARHAQAFTIQLESNAMKGGVYVHRVEAGGVADQAGIQVGDIIINYDGQDTVDMPAFVNATKSTLKNNSVEIRWLRLQQSGHFENHVALIQGGAIGIGTMPI